MCENGADRVYRYNDIRYEKKEPRIIPQCLVWKTGWIVMVLIGMINKTKKRFLSGDFRNFILDIDL